MWVAVAFGYWLSLIIAVPAAGFLVLLFMIQHDRSHGASFRGRAVNDWLSRQSHDDRDVPNFAWSIACDRRQTSYGVNVSVPIHRCNETHCS
jgi:hypothetical protein